MFNIYIYIFNLQSLNKKRENFHHFLCVLAYFEINTQRFRENFVKKNKELSNLI